MAAPEAATYSFTLLIDAPRLQLLVAGLCLAAALLAGAIVIALVGRWRRQREEKDDLSPSAQLAHFRSLQEAGTISAEEFERLRTLLTSQMRATLGKPAASLPPSEEPETRIRPGVPPPEEPETGIRPG